MFCTKCGKPLDDNDKFCVNCGTPVDGNPAPQQAAPQQAAPQQAVPQQAAPQQAAPQQAAPQQAAPQQAAPQQAAPQQQAPQQAAPQQAAPQQTAPQQAAPQQQAPQQAAPQQAAPQQAAPQQQAPQQAAPKQAAPKQAAPKKPFPKAAKLAIIFSSIGVAVLVAVLIILFAVVLPMFNRVDTSKYITMTFDSEETVYDGQISGVISFDMDKLEEDFAKKLSNPRVESAVENIVYNIDLDYAIDGSDEETDVYPYYYVEFSNAKQEDVFNVSIEWPTDSYSLAEIKQYEKIAGLTFDKSAKTISLKVADAIANSSLTVEEPTEINLLDYINDNDLITVKPSSYSGNMVYVDEFETKLGGYTLKKSDYYSSYVKVYDEDDDYIADIYLEFSEDSYLKDGQTITLDYSDYNSDAISKGLSLTGDAIEYTVAAPELLTAENAKTNVAKLKAFFLENVADYDYKINDGDVIEINETYFVAEKDNPDYTKLVFVYYNKTQKYYKTVDLTTDGYFADGEFVYEGYGYDSLSEDTLAKAKQYSYYLDTKTYTVTKLD